MNTTSKFAVKFSPKLMCCTIIIFLVKIMSYYFRLELA